MEELSKRGYTVRIACWPDNGKHFGQELTPFRPIAVPFSRQYRPAQVLTANRELLSVINEVRPALVHLHSPAAALPARLIPRKMLPPHTKVAYTVHGFPFDWEERMSPRGALLRLLERLLSFRTDLLLFQSLEDLFRATQASFGGRLWYLGNGVASSFFELDLPSIDEPRSFLFIGRLTREKGLLDLAQAFQVTSGTRLSLAGGELQSERDGIEEELRNTIRRNGDGRIVLLGDVPTGNMAQVMNEHHVVVLPSYREGLPRSVLEGMAAGRPCIGTCIRGTREVVVDGSSGFLVAPGQPGRLAEAIERMCDMSPRDFQKMSRTARHTAYRHFRESLVFDRLVAAYAAIGVAGETG